MSEIEVRNPSAMAEWDELLNSEDTVTIDTPELVKDDDLDFLVGYPLIVTRMTFRKGVSRKGKPNYSDKHPNDAYVSLECRLHPQPDINRVNSKRKQADLPPLTGPFPFDTGSTVVINDGSTGIYRQCVAYLASRGTITLPDNLPLTGEKGATALDLTPGEWAEIDDTSGANTYFDEDGFQVAEFETRLAAKSGIKPSNYTWDDREAQTLYLA